MRSMFPTRRVGVSLYSRERARTQSERISDRFRLFRCRDSNGLGPYLALDKVAPEVCVGDRDGQVKNAAITITNLRASR